jgi:hypothetical protein
MQVFEYMACVVLLGASSSCRCTRPKEGTGSGTAPTPPAAGKTITGTVRYIDLEGGFYGIETDDGAHLDPVNLPEPFRRDGLRVQARVERLKDRASFHMWGQLVRIVTIEPQ